MLCDVKIKDLNISQSIKKILLKDQSDNTCPSMGHLCELKEIYKFAKENKSHHHSVFDHFIK